MLARNLPPSLAGPQADALSRAEAAHEQEPPRPASAHESGAGSIRPGEGDGESPGARGQQAGPPDTSAAREGAGNRVSRAGYRGSAP